MSEVRVTKRGEDRVQSGHPWVYKSDIAEARASAGATVRVLGPRGRVLGDALFSDKSEITIRMLTRGEVRADRALWRTSSSSSAATLGSIELESPPHDLFSRAVGAMGRTATG